MSPFLFSWKRTVEGGTPLRVVCISYEALTWLNTETECKYMTKHIRIPSGGLVPCTLCKTRLHISSWSIRYFLMCTHWISFELRWGNRDQRMWNVDFEGHMMSWQVVSDSSCTWSHLWFRNLLSRDVLTKRVQYTDTYQDTRSLRWGYMIFEPNNVIVLCTMRCKWYRSYQIQLLLIIPNHYYFYF